MGLDYVLEHPGFRFLPTEEDKMAFFSEERNLPKTLFPTRTYRGTAGNTDRYFVDKYPIRIDPATGQVAFCFVDDGAFSELGFDTWLAQYDSLIRAVEGSEVVFVSVNLSRFESARKTLERHFSTAKSGSDPAELLAYFELRKDIDAVGLRGRTQAAMDIWKRLRKTYAGADFETQYAAWLAGAAIVAPGPAMAVSTYHLNHSYAFSAGAIE